MPGRRELLSLVLAVTLLGVGSDAQVGPRPAAGRPPAAPVRRALLIGINAYPPIPAGTPEGKIPARLFEDLEGPVNDVEAIRGVLIARYDFRPENIRVLTNAEATGDRILRDARSWLVEAAAPGDISLFFFAGHGSQVHNSKSDESDHMDETIVPVDVNLGRRDVRDKELRRLFNEAVDKRITLTAIFDSCHSGSIARGWPGETVSRFAPPDMRDVADPYKPVPPETRGALILSAAQERQNADEGRVPDEGGAIRGLFSWALVKTLRTMPVNESAERLFLRVRALMQSGGTTQEPVLAGTPQRKTAALFGASTSVASTTSAAVQSIEPGGVVRLQGGFAAGIRPGAELTSADSAGTVLRVVSSEGPSLSRAQVIRGPAAGARPGALFVLTKWTAPPGQPLKMSVRPSQMSAAQIAAEGQALSALAADRRLTWVDDLPAAAEPVSLLQRTDSGWRLFGRDRAPTAMGASVPAFDRLSSQLIPREGGGPRLMSDLPLPAEAAGALQAGHPAVDRLVEIRPEMDGADYTLVGRFRNGDLEYAWVRPVGAGVKGSLLPAATRWIPLRGAPAALINGLQDLAVRLSVVHHWLQLESPPDSATFPYHLALKHGTTGVVTAEGTLKPGNYRLVLTLDDALVTADAAPRYVYAFAIDSDLKSQVLFPALTAGNVENLLPLTGAGTARRWPREIRLGLDTYDMGEGIDTFFLLTTATALPDPNVLSGDAVRSAFLSPDPLTQLLSQGAAARGDITTPMSWSIERFTVVTKK